ncbi:hypothetical protein [Ideonella oryzae]|uniref:Flagellar protein FliT n=1 Tax=Ideonella oryzae TaxID=2937441 RepID=A0ABT1BMK0_9BURK|nr:hypothetical protein [Ideonella oryzae]MCO5977069.1 hypothetical protein [Ideonella oryzae]
MQQLQAELARGLALAHAHQDWRVLIQADAALARELPALARSGPWSQAERAPWNRLCETHARARAACEDAMNTLHERLQTLAERREGWLAYAMADLEDPLETQP